MVTNTQIIEAVRAALPHNSLLDTIRSMVCALRDVQWEWLLRGGDVPFIGWFPIDLYMALLIVVVIAVVYVVPLAAGAVVLLAFAPLSAIVVQAAPILVVIVNIVHTARGSLGR